MSKAGIPVIALIVLLGSAPLFADPPEPDPVPPVKKLTVPVIDAKTAATPRYMPIEFTSHDAHAKRLDGKCGRCHHKDTTTQGKPQACGSCHARPDADLKLVDAYHKQCRDCHKDSKAKKADSPAPLKCLGCHKERGGRFHDSDAHDRNSSSPEWVQRWNVGGGLLFNL